MTAKVLLVEADSTSGADLRSALARSGYSVTLIRDGQLGLARAVSERFDAVLVSAELPGINGFRLCNRIRKDPNVGDVRLFIIGAEAEEFAAHERLPTRADSYFKKPVVVAELIARMRLHGIGEAPPPSTLNVEIASARKDVETIAELRKRIAEQDELLERTTRELAKAQAAAVRTVPPPNGGVTPPTLVPRPARSAALPLPSGSRLSRRPEGPSPEIVELRQRLEEQKATEKTLRDNIASLETEAHTLGQRVREQARMIAVADKQQKAHVADRELARKQIEELTSRLERAKEDMQRLRDEAVAARKDATHARGALESAKAEALARWKTEHDELDAKIVALEKEAAAQKAELEAARATDRERHDHDVSIQAELRGRERRTRELEGRLGDLEARTRELEESKAAALAISASLKTELETWRERAALAESAREQAATEIDSVRAALAEVAASEKQLRESLAALERIHRDTIDAALAEHAAALEAERRRGDEEALARVTAEHERAAQEDELQKRDDALANDLLGATRAIAQLRQEAGARDRDRAELERKLADAQAALAKADRTRAETEKLHAEALAKAARTHAARLEAAVAAAEASGRDERQRLTDTQRDAIASALVSARREIEAERAASAAVIAKLRDELDGATTKIADLERSLESARAEVLAAVEAARADRDRIVAELATRHTEQLDALKQRESRAVAESAAREQAHARALAGMQEALEAERAWFEIQLRERPTTSVADDKAVRAALEASIDELSAALVAAHREADVERREWLAQRTTTAATIRALEASLDSREDAIEQLEREIDDAHREVPQLEAEIVVLRSELMNLRRQLDTQVLHERAAIEQLERDRDLLARAQRLLEENGHGES